MEEDKEEWKKLVVHVQREKRNEEKMEPPEWRKLVVDVLKEETEEDKEEWKKLVLMEKRNEEMMGLPECFSLEESSQ